jgi:branched-subunit amino acid aminotransferase/4-amino-4-deoxychorismate lyase
LFWYNGQLIQESSVNIAIDDPGLLYGATVFTTLRVYCQSLENPLTNWKAHCDRLLSSLQTLGWTLPDWHRLRDGAQVLSASYPVLRITIFPNGREWITGRFLPIDLAQRQQQGIAAWPAEDSDYQRSLPAHKTGNYLTAWLAQQAARQRGAAEAILVGMDGSWLETSTGNLWGWQDGYWWTPLTAGILPGIARSQLIDWLKSRNCRVREIEWDAQQVLKFEAVAYTNSVVEVIPIHTVLNSHTPLKYDPFHPSLEQLRSLWRLQ